MKQRELEMKLSELVVGQQVAVGGHGGGRIMNLGIYTVVKANKLKIVLERVGDGYVREFSIKRGVELGNKARGAARSPFIESVEDLHRREAAYAAERDRKDVWMAAEQAAREKDLAKLKDMVSKLEHMGV